MSEHGSTADQLRLSVVAALVGDDTGPERPGTGWADSAASDELSLADALLGPAGQLYRRLALPELAGAARDRAHGLLGTLTSG